MLVLLRLAIGWHFFKEGVSHYTDPAWSSEGFLRQAKGPLADAYQSMLPDFHGWNRLMLAPLPDDHPADAQAEEATETPAADVSKPKDEPKSDDKKSAEKKTAEKKTEAADSNEQAQNTFEEKKAEKKDGEKTTGEIEIPVANQKAIAGEKQNRSTAEPAYQAWLDSATADWRADIEKYTRAYHFDKDQQAKADAIATDVKRRLEDDLKDYEPDIRLYRQLVARADRMAVEPGAGQIPNQVVRTSAALQNPLGERGINGPASPITTTPAAWMADAQAYDQFFHKQLRGLLTPEQQAMAAAPGETGRLHRIDTGIAWLLMIAGGCLIIGLFTRLAAVVGAVFLLSIICAQPPWLATSVQTYTYNQVVEMLALLALATTPVGRWAGLDYLIHRGLRLCCGGRAKAVAEPTAPTLPPGVNMPPAMQKRMS